VIVVEVTSPILIHSVVKIDADGEQPDFWVLANNGVIERTGIGQGWPVFSAGAEIIDGSGMSLTPGFIDIHFHGGGGHSNEGGSGEIQAAMRAHRVHGTTRFVVSLVANPLPELLSSLALIADLTRQDPFLLGSHLEGPYLDNDRRGAHNREYLIDPNPLDVELIMRAAQGTLRHITIDPARVGALSAIRSFTQAGIVVALGHTSANYDVTLTALRAGARLLTHTFNAMPGINHREPGPVMAALDSPGTFFEIILDGKHVHPRIAAFLMSNAPHQVAIVTDAMAAACSVDGRYTLGTVEVTVENGTATLLGTATLAGSTLTLDEALRIGISAGISRVSLVEAITLTPARVLGVHEHLGLVRKGFLSDLVLLDRDAKAVRIFLGGRLPTLRPPRSPAG
jgi:N-acetylglucosamine-6-phosphate deacetylase